MDSDLIADLYYIGLYAEDARNQLFAGKKPLKGMINRMVELSQHVDRSLDEEYSKWAESQMLSTSPK